MTGDLPADDTLEVRLAQYERLVEQTAPPLENPARCTCDRCTYVSRRRSAAA